MCGGTGKTLSRTELETGGRMLRCPKCLGQKRILRGDLRSEKLRRSRAEPPVRPAGQSRGHTDLDHSALLGGAPPVDPQQTSATQREPETEQSGSQTGHAPVVQRSRPPRPPVRGRSDGGGVPPVPPVTVPRWGNGDRINPSPRLILVIALVGVLILAGLMYTVDEQLRSEVAEWVGRRLNPQPASAQTPDPSPVVVLLEAPTETSTPTPKPDSVATIVAMALASAVLEEPTPTPFPTLTVIPTVTSTPTPIPPEYRIDSVDVNQTTTGHTVAITVTKLIGAPSGAVPIRMSVDGAVETVAYVTGMTTGIPQTYVFDTDFGRGNPSVTVAVGDATRALTIGVQTPTPSVVPSPSPSPTPTSSPTPLIVPKRPTPEPTPFPILSSAVAPSPTATVTLLSALRVVTATPTVAPIPTITVEPHLKHLELKQYMLELINTKRGKAGVSQLELGENNGAQIKADTALRDCHSSHWELNGLTPWMRYHLEGGYQPMGENSVGGNWCLTASDGYGSIGNPRRRVEILMDSLEGSPAHWDNVLHKRHRKVNIGMAWDTYNTVAYQQFEGDYVEYAQLPVIENGILSFSGRTKPPVGFQQESDLSVSLGYHQPPRPLTVGQVMSVYAYTPGHHIASFRWPLQPGWNYPNDEFSYTYCYPLDPYDLPVDAPTPHPLRDVAKEWRQKHGYEFCTDIHVTAPWVTTLEWEAKGDSFSFRADISDLLEEYGPGVYSISLSGPFSKDERSAFSDYSLFYGIEPPDRGH